MSMGFEQLVSKHTLIYFYKPQYVGFAALCSILCHSFMAAISLSIITRFYSKLYRHANKRNYIIGRNLHSYIRIHNF